MRAALSNADLKILLAEANTAACRFVRRWRLDRQDIADVVQDLITDCLARLPAFDPCRGTLGAFAGCVMAHRAQRLGTRVLRERRMFGTNPVSLDDPVPDPDSPATMTTRGALIAESKGYGALMGQPTDWTAVLERRLDLERATRSLDESARSLCVDLADAAPQDLSEAGRGSRAAIYRRVRELRLSLLCAGVAGP
jgi:hypothetical protein